MARGVARLVRAPRPVAPRPPRRPAAPRRPLPACAAVAPTPAVAATVPVLAGRLATTLELRPSGQAGVSGLHGAPLAGSPEPMGATPVDGMAGAYNFAVFASGATSVSIVFFTRADLDAGRATAEVRLDPEINRTGHVWHALVPGLDEGLLYGYRVAGPNQDDEDDDAPGHRYDETAVLLDPYARAVLGRRSWGELGPDDPSYGTPGGRLGAARMWPQAAAALPPRVDAFDWRGDRPLALPMEDLVIYEMHVRGFTADPSSGVAAPGTFAGAIEKLDYLASLGVNAVELLPVFEFNELEYYAPIPGSDPPAHRFNYWGYSTVSYFAPMARFTAAAASGGGGAAVMDEVKLFVREAHARGIEVILDVVFNHTAEGDERGPTLSFRGLDNRVYYMLAPAGQYYNYSGCGNTLNCNHPAVRTMIVACLRAWVLDYHVDGFRFDLASILTRAHSAWHAEDVAPDGTRSEPHARGAIVSDEGYMSDGAGVPTGTPLSDPPLVADIAADPVLRGTKLIAEAWDCDGLNQVGAFPHYGGRWAEWNGTFRDAVRAFVKGADGPWAAAFASALCGSPNVYASPAGEGDWWGSHGGARWRASRGPAASVNFVTAHDGFTLADLVAYNDKHNEANGEDNRDGESHNLSWNCGVEGPTDDPAVLRLRDRQARNLAAALLLSAGVPMLHMGDEYGHTKHGNNNTYCHDGPLNWVDWRAATADARGLRRFVAALVRLRAAHPELRRTQYVTDGEVEWHGTTAGDPDWSDASRLVAASLRGADGGGLYIAFSSSHLPTTAGVPHWHGRRWVPVIDTGKPAPYDALVDDGALSADALAAARAAPATWAAEGAVPLLPYSCVVLESVPEHGDDSPPRPMSPQERAAHAAAVAENERLRAQIAALDGGGGEA